MLRPQTPSNTVSGAGLDAHLVVDRGHFHLDVRIRLERGEVVALLGPNGSGKTTALRALAGLTPLSAGHIRVGDQVLDDCARRIHEPPEGRRVGLVFQEYLLFPHLSALDNVAFGPRQQGATRAKARLEAAELLRALGIADCAHRRPGRLSGGQAQRVALARTLATQPALLLLDEPLSALDAQTRLDTRAELRRQLHAYRGTTLLVTHDPLDALALTDRMIIIEDGAVVQEGSSDTIAAHPSTDYITRLVGCL